MAGSRTVQNEQHTVQTPAAFYGKTKRQTSLCFLIAMTFQICVPLPFSTRNPVYYSIKKNEKVCILLQTNANNYPYYKTEEERQ